ncbi:MAG: hypothetical protein A2Z70_01350 [Chloroflexi bacterium RBG_13_48_17]|nr:MAG: hypothetical protein A2Z70_01350 [Chloroflexi bacterium RBG_13_48_17]
MSNPVFRRFTRLLLVAVILAGSVMPVLPQEAKAVTWWDASWQDRMVISFDARELSENWTNALVTINLNSPRIDFSKVLENGIDIRAVDADDATLLPADNLTWDESGNCTLQISVPQIDAYSYHTDFIYLYYNNPAAASYFSATSVSSADSHTVGSWNLYRPSNSGATIYDQTALGFNMSSTNTTYSTTGRVFGGVNSFLYNNTSNYAASNTTGTIVAWFKTASPTNQEVFGTGDFVANKQLRMGVNVSKYLNLYSNGGGSVDSISGNQHDVVTGNFWMAAYSSNDTAYSLLLGSTGVAEMSSENFTVTSGTNNGNWFNALPTERDDILIGCGVNTGNPINSFNGTIGEVQIYDDVKSLEYMKYRFKMERHIYGYPEGDFLRYGDENPTPAVTTGSVDNLSMDKDGVTTGNFTGSYSGNGTSGVVISKIEYGTTVAYGSTTERRSSGVYIQSYYPPEDIMPYILVLPNGEFLGGAGVEASGNFTPGVKRSADKGVTWSSGISLSNYTVAAIHLVLTDNNSVIAYYGKWVDTIGTGNCTPAYRRSEDFGYTWSPEVELNQALFPGLGTYAYPTDTPLLTRSGAIIVPMQSSLNGDSRVIYSWDNGLTHNLSELLSNVVDNNEPTVIERTDGSIYAWIRTSVGFIYESISNDDGATWTEAASTGIPNPTIMNGAFSCLKRITWSPNLVVGLYDNNATYRYPLVIVYSTDDAATWSAPITIASGTDGMYVWRVDNPNFFNISDDSAYIRYLSKGDDFIGVYTTLDYLFGIDTNPEVINRAIPNNLTPGETYHYRVVTESPVGESYGSDETFTLTMPTVTTVSAVDGMSGNSVITTLTGTLDSLGVASDAYVGFVCTWEGGSSSTETTANSTGAYSLTVTIPLSASDIDVVAYARVGTVYSYGSTVTLDRFEKFTGMRSTMQVFGMLIFLTFMGSGISSILAAAITAVRLLRR